MKQNCFFILGILFLYSCGQQAMAQVAVNKLEIAGDKREVLVVKKGNEGETGTLSTGEVVKTRCYQGDCFFQIEYKGRIFEERIGDDIQIISIYEYDFGGDGDKEIIVINEYRGSSFLYVYMYARGIGQKIFEKEILFNRTVIRENYIEYYLPAGLASIWTYYQGRFWEMSPVKI